MAALERGRGRAVEGYSSRIHQLRIERETQKHITAGLSAVDDLTRDIPYAFRTFRRAPLAALTIVATVALGLGLVAVVFTVYDILFLRADAGRSPGELFAVELEQLAVSSEYFNVLGFEVVSGRNFTRVERTVDAGVAIVSETIARHLWPNGDGVGQQVRLDAPQSASPGGRPLLSRTLTVVGVVRNPGRDSGGVYFPTSPETPETALFLRVRGNPEQARQLLLERLSSIDPALSNIMTLRAMAGMQAYTLQIAFWVAVVLGGLALVLTVSGLFSVLSYVVEQRAEEIGVRMALGATTRNIAGLVLSQSLGPIGIGLVAGGGIAAALAIVLVATPVASEIPDIVHVFDPVAYAASLLVIVTSCALAVSVPALRAARIDPIATLRRD